MSVEISIPTALRSFAGGRPTITVQATTVGQALRQLTQDNPQLAQHLLDADGQLRSFVNVYLNDEDIRHVPGGQNAPVGDGDSLIIVPSIAGGAS